MRFSSESWLAKNGKFFSVSFVCAFPRKFCKVVGFKLNAVQLFVAADFLYLFFGIFLRHYNVSVFVAGEFVEKILMCEFLAIFFFCAEIFGNRECRHDRT